METTLRFAFTGDVCLGAGALEGAGDRALPALLEPFAELFGQHDLVAGNLECALVAADAALPQQRQLMAVPVAQAAGLRESGFSVLTLANNHVFDCGREGLQTTLAECERQGIAVCGAGLSRKDAMAPRVLAVGGRTIAVFAACDHSAHFATDASAGIAPIEPSSLREQVRLARAQADLVVVVLHADLEFADCPAPWRVALARALVTAGAHLVVQHHPHVFQGYERHGAGVIAYSLGNFVFKLAGNEYQQGHPATAEGLVLSAAIDFRGSAPCIEPQFLPLRIGADHFPRLATGSDANAIMKRFAALSDCLADRSALRSAWRTRCDREARQFAYSTYYSARRGRFGAVASDLWSALTVPEDRRWLAGWLTRGAR
jgi:hypothetical protein